MEGLCMGIDLGTTSVKVTLLKKTNNDNVTVRSILKPTKADIHSDVVGGSEQNPVKIVSTLAAILEEVPMAERSLVQAIGVTGQMHGVLLWKDAIKDSLKTICDQNSSIDELNADCSPLYTWQDQRCSPDFISSLPVPDSHLNLATGYGCATLLWLQKHKPEFFGQFTMCGTVMDFVLWLLCGLKHPVTSPQLAASMGYFNCQTNTWNEEHLSKMKFPVNVLPQVSDNGSVVGKLANSFHGLKSGTSVINSLGDVQCAAYSVMKSQNDAVLNMSTSCQLMFATKDHVIPQCPMPNSPILYYPYFNGAFLVMAASLNGGNILSKFMAMCKQWISCFGLDKTEKDIWEVLLIEGNNKIKLLESEDLNLDSVSMSSTLYGERHCPEKGFQFSAKNDFDFDLGNVFFQLCFSLVSNIHQMMPLDFLKDNAIRKLITTGSVIEKNVLVKRAIQSTFCDLEINHGGHSDSALGAALYCQKIYYV